jgi:flagellar biosynthesis protein
MSSPKNLTIKKAAALRYDAQRDEAPRIVARGRGKLAEKIVAVAREHNIPLVEDANLAQVLEALDVEREIPAELYRAVAEVLVFVYRLNQRPSS